MTFPTKNEQLAKASWALDLIFNSITKRVGAAIPKPTCSTTPAKAFGSFEGACFKCNCSMNPIFDRKCDCFVEDELKEQNG